MSSTDGSGSSSGLWFEISSKEGLLSASWLLSACSLRSWWLCSSRAVLPARCRDREVRRRRYRRRSRRACVVLNSFFLFVCMVFLIIRHCVVWSTSSSTYLRRGRVMSLWHHSSGTFPPALKERRMAGQDAYVAMGGQRTARTVGERPAALEEVAEPRGGGGGGSHGRLRSCPGAVAGRAAVGQRGGRSRGPLHPPTPPHARHRDAEGLGGGGEAAEDAGGCCTAPRQGPCRRASLRRRA